jgi:uncharacterized membrane protein
MLPDPILIRLQRIPWRSPLLAVVSLLLFGWLLNTPAGLLGKADAAGYAVCHRIEARSFHLGDRQLPMCARCTGMYLGAIAGLAYQAARGQRRAGMPPWPGMILLGLLVIAFGVDGGNSFLHLIPGAPSLYAPRNELRLLTGSGMGAAISILLFPAFNQSMWKDWDPRPALPRLGDLAGLLLIVLAVDGLVLLENPVLLFPLAILSATGILTLLSMVYAMVWLMALRAENRLERPRQLFWPLLAGLGIALLQIALLDYGRFILTGTWGGFHFG